MVDGRPWLKLWPEGVPTTLKYPEETLPRVLEMSANDYPGKPAIIFEGVALTYEKLNEYVNRFALALQDHGVRKGDRVALYLPNCPQYAIAAYGALKAGAVVVPCSAAYKEEELRHQLNDSGTKVLVTHEGLLPTANEAVKGTGVEHLIVTLQQDYQRLATPSEAPESKVGEHPSLTWLLQRYEANPSHVPINPKEDLAFICYTGGTTGVPKGSMLTHFNCLADQLHEITFFKYRRGVEVAIIFLPLFHIYGLNRCLTVNINNASTIILFERFNLIKVLEAIQQYRVTIFYGVPTAFTAILNCQDLKNYDLSAVRIWKSAAAALPTEVWLRFKELTGANILIGWGLTEASPGLTLTPLNMKEYRPNMIGIPEIDTEVTVFDLDKDVELPPGAVGELLARGPQVMKGYWNKPEETAKAFRGGYLCTGDLGYMDEDGMFYFVDRIKDVIKVAGFQVWPTEVEDVLSSHPALLEAAVVGSPDEYYGEVPKAYVILKSRYEGKVTEDELKKYCEKKLAKYKVPKKVEFVKELPKTPSGKILRRVLRDRERREHPISI